MAGLRGCEACWCERGLLEEDGSVAESELDVSFEASLGEARARSIVLVLCFRESFPAVGSAITGVSAWSGGGTAAG